MSGQRYYRKVLRITAESSPNVRLALAQRAAGLPVTGEQVVDGVLSWAEYKKRRATWDLIQQTVSLDARFYEGRELKLFPQEWLTLAHRLWLGLRAGGRANSRRAARGVGVDPAEGGDRTSMSAVDEYGLLELVSRKTPNTDDVPNEALAFARKWGAGWEDVVFDRGGGGKQHADRLRAQGYRVRTVSFGEPLSLPIRRGLHSIDSRRDLVEDRYAFAKRRDELYGELSLLFDPGANPAGFALPPAAEGEAYERLIHQLSKFPKRYDGEGRLDTPPKNKRDKDSKVLTLVDLIGHSPDEADSFALAVHAMLHKPLRAKAGAV